MAKIRFIKDTEKFKVGQEAESSKKSTESYVSQGYAIYVDESQIKKEDKPKDLVKELWEKHKASKNINEPEKDKQPIKFLLKKPKLDGSGAFHEKAKKNKKVNLGGPSKTKKKVSGSVNRNMLKTRDKKRKDKK